MVSEQRTGAAKEFSLRNETLAEIELLRRWLSFGDTDDTETPAEEIIALAVDRLYRLYEPVFKGKGVKQDGK